MTIGIKKAALGLILTFIGLVFVLPLVFWLISVQADAAFHVGPILPIPVSLILAATFILIGIFWITWAYSYLVFVGKGLPFEVFGRALQPTQVLVTTGPYAYTRNPMVLGALFVLLGVAFLARSPSGLILVPIASLIAYIYLVTFEEKALLERFGSDYEEYRRNVPALIPRLSPYIHEPAGA